MWCNPIRIYDMLLLEFLEDGNNKKIRKEEININDIIFNVDMDKKNIIFAFDCWDLEKQNTFEILYKIFLNDIKNSEKNKFT